ncbi:hypothetical protein [Streptomyces syringium]|uniref:HNH endonuclease n=1 Tax=Streptomyces syringium TaxID=76729 RepID=UPI0033CAF3E1
MQNGDHAEILPPAAWSTVRLCTCFRQFGRRCKAVATERLSVLQQPLADTCEICGTTGDVEVNHIRALADLAGFGWPPSDWARVMLDRRRKTVVACVSCHDRLHVA